MAKRKRLLDEWQSFERSVIPKNAPPVQRQEMRRAFYAGASAMLSLCQRLGEDDISEEEGAKVLESYNLELQEFLFKVGKGL